MGRSYVTPSFPQNKLSSDTFFLEFLTQYKNFKSAGKRSVTQIRKALATAELIR